jgi:hypothetical protein
LKLLSLSILAGTLVASSAAAAPSAPDLTTTIVPPTGTHVYEAGTYRVVVANVGTATAQGVSVAIQLPRTHTSPTVHLMGTLGSYSGCTRSGTTLTCALGTLRRNREASASFVLALPLSAAPLEITATATTLTSEPIQGNNQATHTASLLAYDVPITAPRDAHVQHCTGQNLTSFFECVLYPSSLAWHELTLHPGGAVTFGDSDSGPVTPEFYGTWSQTPPDETVQELTLSYYDSTVSTTVPMAEFHGFGTEAGTCFEGVTTFPGSSYVSPYEVCLLP